MPSSAQTSPSHITSKAPKIHPSIACGPPIARHDQRDRNERPDADHIDHVERCRTGHADAANELSRFVRVCASRRCSGPVKSALDVFHRQPKNHGPAVRTCRRRGCQQQAVDQPLHLFRRELHVDLHRGFAGEARGDVVPKSRFCTAAFSGVDVIEYLGKQIAGFGRPADRSGSLLIATVRPDSRISPNPSDPEIVLDQLETPGTVPASDRSSRAEAGSAIRSAGRVSLLRNLSKSIRSWATC